MALRLHALIFLTLCLCYPVQTLALDSQSLSESLDHLLDSDPTARRTTVALKVIDVQSGEVLYDRFGDRLLTPASNLKIYTSACALDTFGPEHCFPTTVSGIVDKQSKSIVGKIVLMGGGNSMLSMADLRTLAERVAREWGVESLHGEVVVSNSRYHNIELGPGWMWDDQPYYFNMRVTPTMVDFNVRETEGVGSRSGEKVRVAAADPTLWVASCFTRRLREAGIKIDAQANVPAAGDKRTIQFDGTDLADTLKHFNHESENAVGEVLLHEIAIANGIRQPSWADGSKKITEWLQETAGLEPDSFKLVDGSGLSRYNLISADSSVALLRFMRSHKHYSTFINSLPAYSVKVDSGEERSLVRAKPGGMSGVSTISGYLQTLEGRQLAFSLLANGYIGSAEPVFALRQKVWSTLVKFESFGE